MVPTPTTGHEAHKTEPDKNTYLVFKHGLTRRRPTLRLRHALPLPGSRERRRTARGYITRINLDADAAHRVTLMATKDADGNQLATIDGSTWDPWAQRLLLHHREPERSDVRGHGGLPIDGDRRVGRAGTRRLRGHPGRLRREHLDRRGRRRFAARSGRRRRSGRTASSTATCPTHPGDLANGKLAGAPGAERATATRSPSAVEAALNNPDQVALHTYGNTFDTRWVTIHDTAIGRAARRSTPTRSPRRADARRSSGLRTAQFQPGLRFQEVLLRRDR